MYDSHQLLWFGSLAVAIDIQNSLHFSGIKITYFHFASYVSRIYVSTCLQNTKYYENLVGCSPFLQSESSKFRLFL